MPLYSILSCNYRISHKFILIFFHSLATPFVSPPCAFVLVLVLLSFWPARNEFETVVSVGRTSPAEFSGWKRILPEEEQRGLSSVNFDFARTRSLPHETLWVTICSSICSVSISSSDSTGDFPLKNHSYSFIRLLLL